MTNIKIPPTYTLAKPPTLQQAPLFWAECLIDETKKSFLEFTYVPALLLDAIVDKCTMVFVTDCCILE